VGPHESNGVDKHSTADEVTEGKGQPTVPSEMMRTFYLYAFICFGGYCNAARALCCVLLSVL
jgi:hypothetical protein